MISKLETTAYPALLFPSKTKLLPSVYQISSGLVRGSSDNPSWGFVQWSKVSRTRVKGERALRGRQEGGWVKNLTRGYSEAWIFHQHYLISEDSLISSVQFSRSVVSDSLRPHESDIYKWPLPFRSCFTWWLVKIVCPQRRVSKHLLS